MMRLASYNVENLFERPRAFALPLTNGTNPVLDKHAEINTVLSEPVYDAAVKERIVRLLRELKIDRSDEGGGDVQLRQNRGKLVRRKQNGTLEIVAGGRSAWNGWVELKLAVISEESLKNTARVIAEVGADVQAVVEAESRPALRAFAKLLIRPASGERFQHTMVIDGNDDRGIDVGILTRNAWEIASMRSHVDDRDGTSEIFSRDCPEYLLVHARSGAEIVVLVNHYKSQIGNRASNDRRRRRQSERTAEIYRRLRAEGHDNVAVVGDFNAGPDDGSIRPLTGDTDLRDAATHRDFDDGGLPGTWGPKAAVKFDYILLSPALFSAMSGGEVFRAGVWTNDRDRLWTPFPSITGPESAGSDHAAVFVDLGL